MIESIDRYRGKHFFLSNFYEVGIYYRGYTYKTLEHAYQAQKTTDPTEMAWIIAADTANDAKYRGNKVQIVEVWDQPIPPHISVVNPVVFYYKDQVMFDLLEIKFDILKMKAMLKDTGDAELLEGNYYHDNYWGQCLCPKCYNKKPWFNKLGKMQMIIRGK